MKEAILVKAGATFAILSAMIIAIGGVLCIVVGQPAEFTDQIVGFGGYGLIGALILFTMAFFIGIWKD